MEVLGRRHDCESDYSADGSRCCCGFNGISSLVIHMLHKYVIKTLVTCNNLPDWLSEFQLLWCVSSQSDQSGLWVLVDGHPWLLSTITTLIILHASYCRALPFERGDQTADERLNNHTALNVLGMPHVIYNTQKYAQLSAQIKLSKLKVFGSFLFWCRGEKPKSTTPMSSYVVSSSHHNQRYSLLFPPKLGQGRGLVMITV